MFSGLSIVFINAVWSAL